MSDTVTSVVDTPIIQRTIINTATTTITHFPRPACKISPSFCFWKSPKNLPRGGGGLCQGPLDVSLSINMLHCHYEDFFFL